MKKRLARERVKEILKNYPETRDAENPDTMVFCLIALEDGVISKEQAQEIYDRYSINNVVKNRQYIQNEEKAFEPSRATKIRRRVGDKKFKLKWREGKIRNEKTRYNKSEKDYHKVE